MFQMGVESLMLVLVEAAGIVTVHSSQSSASSGEAETISGVDKK